MTFSEVEDTFEEFKNRVRSRYGRYTVEFGGSTEIIHQLHMVVARIKEEPDRCVGVISITFPKFRLVDFEIYDKPKPREALPRPVAMCLLSIQTGEVVLFEDPAMTAGNN